MTVFFSFLCVGCLLDKGYNSRHTMKVVDHPPVIALCESRLSYRDYRLDQSLYQQIKHGRAHKQANNIAGMSTGLRPPHGLPY